MKNAFILLLGLILVNCSNSNKKEFTLTGKTSSLKNGTSLYLIDSYSDRIIDSTIVNNNTFELNSQIDSFPVNVILHSKDFKNYNYFWIEDEKVSFNSENSNFKEAVISGSTNLLNHTLKESFIGKNRTDRLNLEKQFIKHNPNSISSAKSLSIYTTTFGKNTTKALFDNFSEENKQSVYGKSIAKYINLNNGKINIGDTFTDFKMMDNNDIERTLSEVKSKYTLLEFWASSCGPCRQENPNLIKTYNRFKEKGFEIFAVSEDVKKEKWLKAIEKDKLPWIHVSDLAKSNKASMIYDINGIPDNFLIDENGIIISRNLRGKKLDAKLEELLN